MRILSLRITSLRIISLRIVSLRIVSLRIVSLLGASALILPAPACWAQATETEAVDTQPAETQPAETQPAGSDGAPTVLQPLRVTAQKREQDIRDVPAALTVVDAQEIEAAGGSDLGSVFRKVPGATFVGLGFPGNNSVSIRGLGGLATFGPYDSAVSFTIDEQVVPLRSFDSLLLDTERVEVLKGPQGTLYGRSAIGGAVNIVTNTMGSDWEADFGAEAGQNGYVLAQGAAGGAVTENILVRGAFRFTDYDGDVENTLTQDDTNQAEVFAGRLTGRFFLGDETFLQARFQADREDLVPTGDILVDAPGFPVSAQSGLSSATRDTDRFSARFETPVGDARLIALAAYEQTEIGSDFDLTDSILAAAAFGLPLSLTADPNNDRSVTKTDEETISAELRLQSDGDSRLDWLVGASYLDLSFDRDLSRRSIIPDFNIDEISTNENTTIAAFGDVSFALTDELEIGGGLRVAHDDLEYEGRTTFFGPLAGQLPFNETDDFEDTYVVGNLRAAYDFGPVTAFARYARGYASAGYGEFAANALVREPIDPFEPATSDSFEIGLRGGNGRFAYSASAFFNDVTDGQAYQFDATTSTNVAENLDYETYGIEAELGITLTDWAQLDLALGLQEAEFNDLPDTTLSGAVDGNRVPLTPEITFSAALSGSKPLPGSGVPMALIYRVSLDHIGDRAADPANSTTLDDFTIIDARVGMQVGAVAVYGFVANLTDEVALLYGQNFGTPSNPIPTANINRGRVIGVGLSATF